jgi:hypothetical protein
MLRKMLIGFAVFVLFLAGAGTFLYYHEIKPQLRELGARSQAQQKMLQPRQVKGEGKFEKRSFYSDAGLGEISQIRAAWPADREGADIAVVGAQGVDFIGFAGQAKKQVRFSIQQRCPIAVAPLDAAGDYGFLTRDESWAVPATLFDKGGHVIWRSGGKWPGVDDSVPADVSGDGKLSVAIGFNGDGGIALLDGQGKTLWKKDETNVWHLEMLDRTGDGREEILHSNAKGQLLVRNAKGDVVDQYLPGAYVSRFVLTRFGEETRPSHILVSLSEAREGCCKPTLVILDAHGKKVTELDSPLGGLLSRMSATPIRFGKGAEYFAVLKNEPWLERSMLFLYSGDGQIEYQEILGESCPGIAALPEKDGERLLVGCTGKIWEYLPIPPNGE